MSGKEKRIIALDYSSQEEALALVGILGEEATYYKVGMELFYSSGGDIVRHLKAAGKKVFLDLKLHDIPNTAAKGLGALTRLGADMLNVHASGGLEMMRRAGEVVAEEALRCGLQAPVVLAVTVLTSIGDADWQGLGQQMPIASQVVRLAKLTKEAGLDGVVASPKEASAIREACGEGFLIVTPGVRPSGSAADDQTRIASPAEALKNGSTHLVIGRPIRKAADPVAAARQILTEMRSVK